MMTPAQVCACRAVDLWARDESRNRLHVILTPKKELRGVQDIVGASMPSGSKCHGSSWENPDGTSVTVKDFGSEPLTLKGGFDLTVCNGGEPPSKEERDNLARWRASAK